MGRIEWVVNPDGTPGKARSIFVGCNGSGCAVADECWAKRQGKRHPECADHYYFKPHLHLKVLAEIEKRRKPTGYFNSMGDPFDAKFHVNVIQPILRRMGAVSRHRFYLSTKQAHRLPQFHFPPNVWLGVSVNRQRDVWRIDELRKTDAAVKFVSFEPLYEYINPDLHGIDWAIVGGETCNGKVTFRPHDMSVSQIIANIHDNGSNGKVFLKDNLHWGVRAIQEFPDASEKKKEVVQV